jgi:hypothetical protein
MSKSRSPLLLRSEQGQAITEYILLISILSVLFGLVLAAVGKMDIVGKLMKPLSGDYSHAYQYGHPKALGFDDGGPTKHPRANGGDNFRIFYAKPN